MNIYAYINILLILLLACHSENNTNDSNRKIKIVSKNTVEVVEKPLNAKPSKYLSKYFILQNQFIVDSVPSGLKKVQKYKEKYYIYPYEKYTNGIKKGKEIELIEFNPYGERTLHKFEIPIETWVYNIVKTEKYYVIVADGVIIVYNKYYKIEKSFMLDFGACDYYLFDSKIVLLNDSFGISGNSEPPTFVEIDLSKMAVSKKRNLPMPKGSAFSSMKPREIFSFYNGKIIVSDITEYKIRIYNYNLELINNINYKPVNWKSNSKLISEIENCKDFNTFRAEIEKYKNISLIERVVFLNDTTLMVTWLRSSYPDLVCDIWIKKNNNWTILESEISYQPNREELEELTIKDEFITYLYGKSRIFGNTLIYWSENPLYLKDYYGKRYKELFEKSNEYYLSGAYRLSIYSLKYKEK